MQTISETMFYGAAARGRITRADVEEELKAFKGDKPHRATEAELWHVSTMYKDLFEPGARELYEKVLTERLVTLQNQGPSLSERAANLFGIKIDSDGDGLSNKQEKRLGTNPFKRDTDEDGWTDDREVERGSDPGRVIDWNK